MLFDRTLCFFAEHCGVSQAHDENVVSQAANQHPLLRTKCDKVFTSEDKNQGRTSSKKGD